jgi:hypothetical protein
MLVSAPLEFVITAVVCALAHMLLLLSAQHMLQLRHAAYPHTQVIISKRGAVTEPAFSDMKLLWLHDTLP